MGFHLTAAIFFPGFLHAAKQPIAGVIDQNIDAPEMFCCFLNSCQICRAVSYIQLIKIVFAIVINVYLLRQKPERLI